MFRPTKNVSDYPSLSAVYIFCIDFTFEPTVSFTIKVGLSLNRRDSKEIVELYHEAVLVILGDDGQVKLSGFGDTHLLQSGQHFGRNTIIGDTLLPKVRRSFARDNHLGH